jgi:haloalkane dehalogenase
MHTDTPVATTTVPVLDSHVAFRSAGEGRPGGPTFVLLHGNPSSSYAWRAVLPVLAAHGRVLAPDLIGMGDSGKPAIAYGFADSARYLDAWFTAVGLDGAEVVLVGHDWGGALAFDRAARHPDGVRGVAVMETIVRPMTWDDFPGPARPRYEELRSAAGEEKVLDQNFFIEQALAATTRTDLSEAAMAAYRRPYPTRESRRPLLAWPREMPIEGEPAATVARIEAYDRWLAASPEVPKLLLTFDGDARSLMIGPEMVAWCRAHVTGLEVEGCGPAAHFALEDRPDAIAAAVSAWAARHGLVAAGA